MAISDDTPQGQPAPKPAAAEARAGLAPSPTPKAPPISGERPTVGSGVHDLPAMLRRSPVGLNGYGENVKKLAVNIKELLKGEGAGESDIKVMVLDKDQRGTMLSAVIIAVGSVRGTQSYAAAHTLLVEASAERMPKISYQAGQQQVELSATAGDAYNNPMWEKVKAVVAEQYPVNTDIRDAACTVIPREMDLADLDRVRKVLFYAIQGVYMRLEMSLNIPQKPFCVSAFTQQDRVSAKIDFTPTEVETTTGLPIRSDVSIILNATNVQNNQFDMMPTTGKDFSRVDGYVDLVFKAPTQPSAMMGMPGYQNVPMYHYAPRLVMTNFAPLLEGVNLELLLLALSSATLLSKNNNYAWGGVFRQRYGADLNIRNIGAIGLEIPALVGSTDGKGAIIDTQASTFNNDSLYLLLSKVIRPQLVYSFDVDEASSLSFIHTAFLAAAQGDHEANQLIIDAANRLTNNAFAQFFPGGAVVMDDQTRIHMGYYIDPKTGKRRDIRDIDYLAVLNMVGKSDVGVAIKWANTFDRTDLPLDIRMDERERLLNTLIGGQSMRITGYGRRITFTPNFIGALDQAVFTAGLKIQPGDRSYFFADQVVRGNDNIDRFAFDGAAATNLFNQGTQYAGGRQFSGNFSRFGR